MPNDNSTMGEKVEEFAKQLSEKVKYMSSDGQYPDGSDEQKAYVDGVNTAVAMMYIDLTGTPKSKGMLETLVQSEIDRAVGEERERTSKIAKEMLQDINFLEGITGKENMDLVYKNHKAMKNYLSLITKQS